MNRCMTLILWACLACSPARAESGHLGGPQLAKELQALEEGSLPDRIYRLRVAALAVNRDAYSPDLQGRIARLQCRAMPAEQDSEYRGAVAFADQELAIARGRKDRLTETGLLICRGFHQQMLGNMKLALADYARAQALSRELGDRVQEADLLSYRGELYSYQGKLAEGLKELIEAYQRYDALGMASKGRKVLALIANTYRRMGLYERADDYFQALEHDYRQQDAREQLVEIHAQQGLLYAEMGEFDRALPLMLEAEHYYQSLHQEGLLAWSRIEVATILLNQGKVSEAMAKLKQVEMRLHDREGRDSVTLAHWQLAMAMVLDASGAQAKALDYLARAETVFARENNQRFLIRIYDLRSGIFEHQGRIDDALTSLKQYVQTRHAIEQALREQRSLQVRFEFDLARKELEMQTLKTRELLQDARITQLQERRQWQFTVVVLLLLVMVLSMLVLYLFNRSRKARRLTIADELTGIYNRRKITMRGHACFNLARSSGRPFSVLLLDIDHFKQIHDQLGHHMGDMVLKSVARCVVSQLRSLDSVGRNGGEAFLVLLPDTGLDEAAEVAERIRQQVSLQQIEGMPKGRFVHVSIGCAQYDPLDDSLSSLLRRADEAMYRARQTGRNRVALAR